MCSISHSHGPSPTVFLNVLWPMKVCWSFCPTFIYQIATRHFPLLDCFLLKTSMITPLKVVHVSSSWASFLLASSLKHRSNPAVCVPLLIPLSRMLFHEGSVFHLCFLVLYLQRLEECLEGSGLGISVCWINEWAKTQIPLHFCTFIHSTTYLV